MSVLFRVTPTTTVWRSFLWEFTTPVFPEFWGESLLNSMTSDDFRIVIVCCNEEQQQKHTASNFQKYDMTFGSWLRHF